MKKIAYIEIDTHAEIALGVYKLLKNSEHFEVDFYVSSRIKNILNITDDKIILSEQSVILDQLAKKKYDLVIIGTMHRYFGVFGVISNRYNSAVINHNLNFKKISKRQLFLSLFKKDFVYRLKLFLKEFLLQKDSVLQKARHHLVLDQNLIKNSPDLIYFPVFYNEFEDNNSTQDFLCVVIPGAVSQQRRDYQHILAKINQFEGSNRKLNFVFLGKAQSPELDWIEAKEKQLPTHITFTYFKEKVAQPIFDSWMQKANFIWCPIKQKTEFFSNEEVYGKSKMTGNIGDAIRYGKMAVFPRNYDGQAGYIVKEQDDLLSQFMTMDQYKFDFKEKYGKDLVKTELEDVIKKLL